MLCGGGRGRWGGRLGVPSDGRCCRCGKPLTTWAPVGSHRRATRQSVPVPFACSFLSRTDTVVRLPSCDGGVFTDGDSGASLPKTKNVQHRARAVRVVRARQSEPTRRLLEGLWKTLRLAALLLGNRSSWGWLYRHEHASRSRVLGPPLSCAATIVFALYFFGNMAL